MGLTRAVTVGLRAIWGLEASATIVLARPSVGWRGSSCRGHRALRCFSIRRDRSSLGSVWCSVLGLFGVALRLLLNLLLLRWVFGDNGDEIRGNWRVEFKAVRKFLQVVQLDFLVILDLGGADLVNISSLSSSKPFEGASNRLLNSGCSCS